MKKSKPRKFPACRSNSVESRHVINEGLFCARSGGTFHLKFESHQPILHEAIKPFHEATRSFRIHSILKQEVSQCHYELYEKDAPPFLSICFEVTAQLFQHFSFDMRKIMKYFCATNGFRPPANLLPR